MSEIKKQTDETLCQGSNTAFNDLILNTGQYTGGKISRKSSNTAFNSLISGIVPNESESATGSNDDFLATVNK
jgi:hypothetical protein